jgi:hypothetical protein
MYCEELERSTLPGVGSLRVAEYTVLARAVPKLPLHGQYITPFGYGSLTQNYAAAAKRKRNQKSERMLPEQRNSHATRMGLELCAYPQQDIIHSFPGS